MEYLLIREYSDGESKQRGEQDRQEGCCGERMLNEWLLKERLLRGWLGEWVRE